MTIKDHSNDSCVGSEG